jgi:predicted nucleic acid-binding protein
MQVVFDTNILIDYLNGIESARTEILKYQKGLISVLTKMEVLVGVRDVQEEMKVRSFLNRFKTIALSEDIAEAAVNIRKDLGIKLPDAIIYATAQIHHCLLVTRNTKDFPDSFADILCPYSL